MEPNENNVVDTNTTEQNSVSTTPQNDNQSMKEQELAKQQVPVEKQNNQQNNQQEEEPKKQKKTKDLRKFLLKSSNLDWIAYDAPKKELYVAFKSNSIYKYYNVPRDIFEGLRTAGSHGRYFAIKVKWNFKYERIK